MRIVTLLVCLFSDKATLVDQDRDQNAIRRQNADLLIHSELGYGKLLDYRDSEHIFLDDGVLLGGVLIIKVEYFAIFPFIFVRIRKVWKSNHRVIDETISGTTCHNFAVWTHPLHIQSNLRFAFKAILYDLLLNFLI